MSGFMDNRRLHDIRCASCNKPILCDKIGEIDPHFNITYVTKDYQVGVIVYCPECFENMGPPPDFLKRFVDFTNKLGLGSISINDAKEHTFKP